MNKFGPGSRRRLALDQQDTHTPNRNPFIQNIILFLVAFRVINALSQRTFFQPDEYFQSLEPAWQMAFGETSGAWITWEWKWQLRSSIHPALFAGLYQFCDALSTFVRLPPSTRAELLEAAPKTLQAIIAGLGDFYTWKLSGRIYGTFSKEAWAALVLTILSPWQWFCSTRTLSNCLETTLTIAALYYWPWQWLSDTRLHYKDVSQRNQELPRETLPTGLRRSLFLAAFACILRPTNSVIWLWLGSCCLLRHDGFRRFPLAWSDLICYFRGITIGSDSEVRKYKFSLIWNAFLCGSVTLLFSLLVDRCFYGMWTFPPYNFLYFNLVQSLAVFYGSNPWHYYLTQGYPLLLTTYLPFTLWGCYRAYRRSTPSGHDGLPIARQLATISFVLPVVLSLISHKEVRFIYPVLPPLHVVTASVVVPFFTTPVSRGISRLRRLPLLTIIALANILIAGYTSQVHQRAPLALLHYLRHQYEEHHLPQSMTIGFLMPCHSTPWRSHLVYPSITAWALTCEPPLDIPASDVIGRSMYVDEADEFYADPHAWLSKRVGRLPRPRSNMTDNKDDDLNNSTLAVDVSKREWPDYVAFFQQLEPAMKNILHQNSAYEECWRTSNGQWNDDWRRRGDIIVYCLRGSE